MKTGWIIVCMWLLAGGLWAKDLNEAFQLIPQPQAIEVHKGETFLYHEVKYILTEDGKWEYVNTNRPIANEQKECEKVFVENLDGKMHEYIIYLPLYDGITTEILISLISH